MGVRSKYREQVLAEKAGEIPAEPNIPKVKIDGEPADTVGISAEIPPHEPSAAVADAMANSAKADEATIRLKKQIDDLKKSEEIQRQRQTVAVQPTPEQALQFWKSNGLDEAGERFLLAHPQHILGLTNFAGQRASQQGHQFGSAAHIEAAKAVFHENLMRLEDQAQQRVPEPSATERHVMPPDDYRPTPAMPPPSSFPLPQSTDEDRRSAFVSAPVSRETPSAGGSRSNRQIRLTAEEREHARMAGVTEVEYAKQKQRLMDEQAAGRYDQQRYR
jgi:hypothetical protein